MNQRMARILCVDDESINLSLLEAMLSPRGYDVVSAANGPEALDKVRTERIDICLLDVMMPGMDGFEVCRRIKSDELHRNIPVVMITSFADTENRIRGIEAGAEDFISKPFDSGEVLARIKMLLHVKSLNDRLQSAYHNIAKLSAFGEQIITNFDPDTFDFLENVDSIVHQIIRRRFDLIDSPEIVVIGMIDQEGLCQWLRYDSTGKDIDRSTIRMDLDHKLAFSVSGRPAVVFYNEADPDLAASTLVRELKKQLIPVSNMVSYSNDSFCLIALNYGREVTAHDAAVINSVVMQSLFLRSLASQVRDTEYAENIVETVREPLVVLNSDLKILTANHSFYDIFKVTPEETIGNFIYDLGNRQWDIPKLRVLFEDILPMIPCSTAMKSSMIFRVSAARSFCSTPARYSGKRSAHTLSSWPWKTLPNASWRRSGSAKSFGSSRPFLTISPISPGLKTGGKVCRGKRSLRQIVWRGA